MEPIIGILGGMGPEATVELFRMIIDLTPAKTDQEHFRIIIDNNPKVPDRTAAIRGEGEDVLAVLADSGRTLQDAGADFLAIPCNTAHYWLEELRQSLSIPVIDMIGETALAVGRQTPSLETVGLLATTGTVEVGLYQKALNERDVHVMLPDEEEQARIMEAIYLVKAADYTGKEAIVKIGNRLIKQGAGGIVLGCTEIPLLVDQNDFSCAVFNALGILAKKTVEHAQKGVIS
jgi:aspartate racemase